jgi:hypothetical protein
VTANVAAVASSANCVKYDSVCVIGSFDERLENIFKIDTTPLSPSGYHNTASAGDCTSEWDVDQNTTFAFRMFLFLFEAGNCSY